MNAEKGVVGDLLSILIWGMATLFMLVFLVVFKQVSDNNHFSAYASAVVARYGGMTQEAKEVIESYSELSYGGRYQVESEVHAPLSYGTPLQFSLSTSTRVLYFDLPLRIQFTGNSVSRVR